MDNIYFTAGNILAALVLYKVMDSVHKLNQETIKHLEETKERERKCGQILDEAKDLLKEINESQNKSCEYMRKAEAIEKNTMSRIEAFENKYLKRPTNEIKA